MSVQKIERLPTEIQNRKSLASQLLPVKLDIVPDAQELSASVCNGGTVKVRAANGLVTAPLTEINFTLSSDNIGKFYKDETCQVESKSFTISAGFSSTRFYFKSGPLRTLGETEGLRMVASTSYFKSPTSVPSTFTSTMNVVNDVPEGENLNFEVNEDQILTVQLSAKDANGDLITFQRVTTPANVDLTTVANLLSSTGRLTFVPVQNFNGLNVFEYRVSDGRSYSARKFISISVRPVNDPPTRVTVSDRVIFEDPGFQLNLDLRNYFTDVDLDPNLNKAGVVESLNYTVESGPDYGTFSQTTGVFRDYLPNENSNKDETIRVRVTDSSGATITNDVRVIVNPVNDAPTVSNFSVSLNEDANWVPVNFAPHVSDVDTDPVKNKIPQSAPSLFSVSTSSRGVFNSTSVSYKPNLNYNGGDARTFEFVDANDNSKKASATVTFSVAAVNDPPTLTGLSVSTNEDSPLALNLQNFVNDPDTDSVKNLGSTEVLSFNVTNGAISLGSLSGSGSSRTFTPILNANGSTSFALSVTDAGSSTASGTVNIVINPVNDAPTLDANMGLTVAEGGTATISNTMLRVGDVDGPPTTALVYTLVTKPTSGNLIKNGAVLNLNLNKTFTQSDIDNSRLVYEHLGAEPASEFFRFSVSDSQGGTISSTNFNITITQVNDAPVAQPKSHEMLTTDVATITLTGSDPETAPANLTYNLVSPPTGASLSGAVLSFDPPDGFIGTVNFSYTVTDNSSPPATSSPASITILVGDGKPEIVRNETLFTAGSIRTITKAAHLETKISGIPTAPASSIVYHVPSQPEHGGVILLSGVNIHGGSVEPKFTQDDINNNRVRFNPGSNAPAAFQFTVDFQDDGVDVLGPIIFNTDNN